MSRPSRCKINWKELGFNSYNDYRKDYLKKWNELHPENLKEGYSRWISKEEVDELKRHISWNDIDSIESLQGKLINVKVLEQLKKALDMIFKSEENKLGLEFDENGKYPNPYIIIARLKKGCDSVFAQYGLEKNNSEGSKSVISSKPNNKLSDKEQLKVITAAKKWFNEGGV